MRCSQRRIHTHSPFFSLTRFPRSAGGTLGSKEGRNDGHSLLARPLLACLFATLALTPSPPPLTHSSNITRSFDQHNLKCTVTALSPVNYETSPSLTYPRSLSLLAAAPASPIHACQHHLSSHWATTSTSGPCLTNKQLSSPKEVDDDRRREGSLQASVSPRNLNPRDAHVRLDRVPTYMYITFLRPPARRDAIQENTLMAQPFADPHWNERGTSSRTTVRHLTKLHMDHL